MTEIIVAALDYIKAIFDKDYSGHDYYHTLRVLQLAKTIANTENCDIDKVCIIALLHDVDDYKLSPDTSDNLTNAKTFLTSHKFNQLDINSICDDISKLSFSKGIPSSQLSLEGKIVQDADRLDAIGAIGIARAFAYGGSHNRAIYNPEKNNNNTTISHFYDKLLKLSQRMNTNKGKEIALERNSFMENYIQQFLNEWNNK